MKAEKKCQKLSLVPRPVRAIRVTRGGLEPSAIAPGLAKKGKKVPDRREKVPDKSQFPVHAEHSNSLF